MKSFVLILVLSAYSIVCSSQDSTHVTLEYGIDGTALSKKHHRQIDTFMQNHADSFTRLRLDVLGSADFLGSIEYNQKISDARVDGVIKYLQSNHGDMIDTIFAKSEGELDNKGYEDERGGVQKHRTVTIKHANNNTSEAIEALGSAESGEKIVFKNLNFQPGRHYLLKKSIPELRRLLLLMQENPSLEIEIQGHICCVDYKDRLEGLDLDTGKYELSINRAKNIYEFLIRKGINPERLNYRGFGSAQKLVYPEITDEDKMQNRRVEIMVVKR